VVTSQKAALSLLITIVLSGFFAAFAFTGLFDLLEARFYNPSVTANMVRDNNRNAEVIDRFFIEMQNRFSETIKTKEIRYSFLSSQSPEDIMARSRIYDLLIASYDGIQWVRFVDSGGKLLHFSSYSQDLLNPNDQYPVYRNYNEPDLPYETVAVNDGGAPKYTFDGRSERVIFSFPLYDSFDIYWGTALFSLSMDAVLNRLINEGRMRFGQNIMVISNPSGLVFGMSTSGERALPSQISSIWKTEGVKTAILVSPSSGLSMALISTTTSQGFIVGKLANEELFSFSQNMKIILLVSFFLTVYLITFLLFTSRQDPVSIIQNRLKQLQISLFEQFFSLKGEADWTQWTRELEYRRGEITDQLKKGINLERGTKFAQGKGSTNIDVLINKSWDELLQVMGSRREGGIDEEKLRSVLKEVLATLPAVNVPQPPVAVTASAKNGKTGLLMRATAIIQKIEDAELVTEVEEIEGLEELEELEELEDVEDIEDVEELEDVEDVEDIEDVEELMEPVEEDNLEGRGIAMGPTYGPSGAHPPVSDVDIAVVASQIEFAPDNEPELTEDELIEQDLEIVSPFSAMLYDFSEPGADEDLDEDVSKTPDPGPESSDMGLELKENRGLPLINDPFSGMTGRKEIVTLEALSESEDEITIETGKMGEIIEEREGVHYISQDALGTEKEADLDRDFKDLVDSVTK